MLFNSNLLSRRGSAEQLKNRLRWFLAIFVLLLTIPIVILTVKSYQQFQKEIFYIYKWKAEHATIQFNEWMSSNLQTEEDRPYTDYQFYQLTNNPVYQRSELTLSPLARISDKPNIRGLIGYFQVDEAVHYSCPLLPFSDNETLLKKNLGIDIESDLTGKFNLELEEVEQRLALREMIRPLLIETGLLTRSKQEFAKKNSVQDKSKYLLKRVGNADVSPFRIIRSKDSKLLLFRDIWKRDNTKIQQGFAVDEKTFFFNKIKNKFGKAGFKKEVLLQIYYDGKQIHSMYYLPNKDGKASITTVNEETKPFQRKLIDIPLDSPFNNFTVTFSIEDLPVSPGASFGTILLAIIIVIMSAGLFLIYRLGTDQIRLSEERMNFVSSVSHELKTPLTSIIMSAEMLREKMVIDEGKKEDYYNFIFFEGERLSRLITNILRLSKLGRDMPDITLEYTPASSAIDLVKSKISTLLENNGFVLELNDVDDVSKCEDILIDTDAFIQIVINLVDNAIKFSKKQCENDVSRQKVILTFQKDSTKSDMLCFSVRDFGPGISKEHSSHIFKIFYRAENELTRTTQGTGIGLALVYELVKTMGGHISFSNRDPGVEFRICLQSRKLQ